MTIVDVLDEIPSDAFPLTIPSVSVYARLTDAVGFYEFSLDVVRREDLGTVLRAELGEGDAPDPLEDVEVVAHGLQLWLPTAGFYDVRLWANGRFLHSVSLKVLG